MESMVEAVFNLTQSLHRPKSSFVILLIGQSVMMAGQLIKQWKERLILVLRSCSAEVHIPYMSNKVGL